MATAPVHPTSSTDASSATDAELETILTSFDTSYAWNYGSVKEGLRDLYEKAKREQWNGSERLAWDTPVDPEGHIIPQSFNPLQDYGPFKKLDAREEARFHHAQLAWTLSQFLHGEQGALLATAKIVQQAPWEEAKFYAANQVADEARHVEVYHRYLTEKLALNYPVHPSLASLLDDIVSDSRWDVTYLGMQIMVEGLALAAFGVMKIMMSEEPLIQDITSRIMSDESRHVAFGVLSLDGIYAEMSESELREREDFIIEATHLMRERLLMHPVFERLGWPVDTWVEWAQTTPFMLGFRQMLFSKIVPNLKRLGLLTPRVREAYDKLGLLRYEHWKDSVEQPEVAPPEELVQFMMQFISEAQQPRASA